MLHRIDTRNPRAVQNRAEEVYRTMFPGEDGAFVPRAFEWAGQCFAGSGDYQPIDAGYHDFEHTMQGTLCLALLLEGRHSAQAGPRVTPKMFELGLLAILLHDTGYLKKKGDTEGTGAKYTLVHVTRSVAFAGEFLTSKGFSQPDVRAVQNMIGCTGVNADVRLIPFQSELEKVLGFALATADLLGQMAAEDYVRKLPILYQEFAEAARSGAESGQRVVPFNSAEDLMRKTPWFWKEYVRPRVERDFGGLYRFLNDPYPHGPNIYMQRIEAHIAELRGRFG